MNEPTNSFREGSHGTVYYKDSHESVTHCRSITGYISVFVQEGSHFVSIKHDFYETILKMDQISRIEYHYKGAEKEE